MKPRLLACATALITIASISACATNVGVNGSAGLSGVQPSSAAPAQSLKATPKPTAGKTVAASPSASATPSTPTTTTDPGGPIIPLPIITKLPILTLADCIAYDPNAVTYVNKGADGYLITDGSSAMLMVDSIGDAVIALNLVRNYNQQCFIGRDNPYTGNDRYRYITEYWTGTGVSGATVPTNDCNGYDNTALAINDLGTEGYQLVAGGQGLTLSATLSEANQAKSLAAAHHSLCYIGRDNTRSTRAAYIVEYWI